MEPDSLVRIGIVLERLADKFLTGEVLMGVAGILAAILGSHVIKGRSAADAPPTPPTRSPTAEVREELTRISAQGREGLRQADALTDGQETIMTTQARHTVILQEIRATLEDRSRRQD